MTTTTIKVPAEIRDRLKKGAGDEGMTMAQYIDKMLRESERQHRLSLIKEQVATNPPDQEYLDELADWESDKWLK